MQILKKNIYIYHLRQKCLFCSSLFYVLGVHSFLNKGSLQCSLQGNLKRDITGRANRKVFSSSFLPLVLPSQATHVCFDIEKDSTAEECRSRRTFSFLSQEQPQIFILYLAMGDIGILRKQNELFPFG